MSTDLLRCLREPDRGQRNLAAIASHFGGEASTRLLNILVKQLPRTPDPDLALNQLERLLAQPPARDLLPGFLESPHHLEIVLQLLATSQFFADTLVAFPETLESILKPPGRSPSTTELIASLRSEVEKAYDDNAVLRAFRRFRQVQLLRIGINDVVRDRPLEEISRDLSRVADASIEIGLQSALATTARKYGQPRTVSGSQARITAFAFGKLGGDELNYSSDLDLMFVYDAEGETADGRLSPISNMEFYAKTVNEFLRLLTRHTDRGLAYRIDLRLRPEGHTGPLARSLASTLSYYDVMGRTWERQALIKMRPCAGDLELGREFVQSIHSFIYRKYFSFSEINEVKALKRQMESRAARTGADDADVKTGRGGIRDIEYTVQFLQLLNGGDLPAVRQRNTLLALEALEIAGCLTGNETYILSDAYRFLRKTEHRLQLLFDMQTHRLPESLDELRRLALRMGYIGRDAVSPPTSVPDTAPRTNVPQKRSPLDEAAPDTLLDTKELLVEPVDLFLKDLHDKRNLDRTILDHLLHQTFHHPDEQAEPESDLILDPAPDAATIQSVLGRYPFKDIPRAYANLSQLGQESVRFLSHRRCRHFLASIAPLLLRVIADTPDPDDALQNLEKVTASLGAKAVLYELFSFNPPSLKLYVDLCAGSPFLSGLLMNNPGMIDDLLDTLMLDQPRSAEEMKTELMELLKGATDPEPILFSFRDKELLRIGVRDLLGKSPISETTAALSDLAEVVLDAVFRLQEAVVQKRYGVPVLESGRPCPYVVLGLGKLGGREISYHSDLDLLVVFDSEGMTVAGAGQGTAELTTHSHYFTELAQKAIKALNRQGPMGRLYAVDMRLRPTGKSGSLVSALEELRRYYQQPDCQTWERQSLTRARVVCGDPEFARRVQDVLTQSILAHGWSPQILQQIRQMREKLESTASNRNLKRGVGGLIDVEFLVQMLQIQHGAAHPEVLRSNLWEALDALLAAGYLTPADAKALKEGYSHLRTIEARLRLVTDRPLVEIPDSPEDQTKLARRLGYPSRDEFLADLQRITRELRQVYLRLMGGLSETNSGSIL